MPQSHNSNFAQSQCVNCFISALDTTIDLDDKSLETITSLGGVLESIHKRMIKEGYEIKDGRIIKLPHD
jgi:hypothetical protein